MRTLTHREKRIVRLGAIAVALYVAFFCGKFFVTRRADYVKLLVEGQKIKQEIRSYEDRVLTVKTLMEKFNLDPAKLSKATAVAETSSAIQKAAASGGIQFGPIRESPGRPSARELASVKLEGSGPLPALITFLHRLDSLGFPVVLDSVQIGADTAKPGMIKLSLTIIIMDFDQWKTEEPPHA
ncbi:MAG: hypothetical protein HOP33_00860 [Verrucomicrobia bacterium]|nr:hypothetical protein [Verrucomicrobiota bacterium]